MLFIYLGRFDFRFFVLVSLVYKFVIEGFFIVVLFSGVFLLK